MRKIVTAILIIISSNVFAKDFNREFLCSHKWFPVQYEEADGTVIPIPKEHQSEYIEYKPDGTFLSIEGKILIKGTWVYNVSDNTVVVTQKINRNYPTKVISEIITLTSDKLVVASKDAGGELLKIQFGHLKN